jgi:hypothetical protein
MSDKLKQLYLLHDTASWTQYQREVSTSLAASGPGTVAFVAEPSHFPCLAASVMRPADPTPANDFCQYLVNCCFVYPQDAARLVDAKEQLDDSILTGALGSLVEPDPVDYNEAAIQEDEEQYGPTQTGVLLLALVNEMDAVGALDRKKLLREVDWVNNWLEENQATNIEENTLAGVLRRMWEDKDAG